MRSGAGQLELGAIDTIKQQPIRLDVKIAEPFSVTLQRMVVVARGERLLFK